MRLFLLTFGAAAMLSGCSAPTPADEASETAVAEQGGGKIGPTPMTTPVARGPAPAAIEAAEKALRTEPKIKDLIYNPDQAVQWQVGVLDDGSSRVGYANYVCEVLKENDALSGRTHVRIVDIAKVAQGTDFRSASLGHLVCETGDVVTP